MATIYTPDCLRNLFQSSFNLAQWYSFLQHFFNATELKSNPEGSLRTLLMMVIIWVTSIPLIVIVLVCSITISVKALLLTNV